MAGPAEPQVSLREERRPITALFADLVGSTALAEQLDEADVKLVVGEAVARVVAEVERLGGYVKDLAGDGVLAFFGAPKASEDDAQRALLAGLAVLDSIGAYAGEVERAWGIPGFGVRVGVATGPVVVGEVGAGRRVEYAAFGDTVNTAARLQGAAEPGALLVDEATRRLVEPLFEWGAETELELKGKRLPVVAHRLLGARVEAAKPRGLAGVDTPLVGRERELERVRESLAALTAGRGGVLLVTGEAGIGKSRLLAEARRSYDILWLEGRCVSYGESLPYWPFRDLVREWLGVALADPELRVRVRLRRAVSELFGERELEIYPYLCALLSLAPEPDAAARLADLSPEALQYRTFEVVETLLERLAAERPLTVLLDDLHWADSTSVQLVERLLRIGERAAVLLVAAQRDDRDHPSWHIRELAAREVPHLLTEIALEPLSGDAQRELLEAAVGAGTLPPDLEERVLAAAEGNPFYLEELLRSLIDAGAVVREDGAWRFDHEVQFEVPPTVERVVLARIDRLPETCREVLTAASALGRHFGTALLEAVLDGTDGLEGALHELQRLDLLRATRRWPQPEFRFKHALIQESAYRTLLPDRRRTLHRAAAEWIERHYEGAESEVLGLLAHHWLEAADEDKAIAYLTRAGDTARLAWALDEAIEHYRRLLALLDRRGERQAMALTLFKLALALHTALRFREANDAYQRAFALWEQPAAGAAAATLRVGMRALPTQVDPPRSYFLPDIQLQMAVFDRLVERWPEATIVPALAERWEISDDGLRYRFHLREGLTWSDGRPLTAHDVVYGVRRNLDRDRPGVSVAMLFALEQAQDYFHGRSDDLDAVGVRALDERTVEFRLVVPAPYFLSMVNRPDAGPQPRHAIEAHGDAWTEPSRLVASGAFTLAEVSADRVVLERRPESRARPGNVRRVELSSPPLDVASERYASDELDIVWGLAAVEIAERHVATEGDLRLEPAAGLEYLVLDHRDPAIARVELRRALAHAVDRRELQAVLPKNTLPATGGMVPPVLQGHTPDIAPAYDPELARELLAASGFAGEIRLAVPEGRPELPAVLALAGMWERTLGLRVVQVDEMTEAQVFLAGWFPGYPDPEYYLRLLLHSEAKDNFGRFRHPPYDELVERARAETDGRRRLELFHAADRMAVAEQVAAIPLAYFRNAFLVKPWVHGWWEYGKSWASFADLVVDERSPRAAG
ncbi:MAG TPA: ABC transporter substrate-binding protein [Gaiellaceae bacterium]|nr:ABC transporter substrate-binding protein [Gaiellaceae bacterium]